MKVIFYINTQFLIIWNLSKYINLLVLAAVLTTLAKLVIFKTRIEKHTIKHNNSQIFKHLHPTATCFQYNSLTFKITDKAHSKFDFKIKEALHINLREPNLKAQQNDLAFTLSPLWSFLFFLLFSFIYYFYYPTLIISYFTVLITLGYYFISSQHTLYHTFFFHLLFSLNPTLIIGIFYCLNYTSLLLHLIITPCKYILW